MPSSGWDLRVQFGRKDARAAESVTVGSVSRSVILALAITAAAVAAVPILAYPFPRRPNWLDPYANCYARWTVYLDGAVALALFIALSQGG
jgi:hypothetical protein